MHAMATESDTRVATTGERAPNSWGLGDGQAIPWEYAPAPEARDIVTLKERYGLFIGGREVPSADGATFTSIDPSTEQPLAQIARATPADIDKAVRAARRAQRRAWGSLPGKERAKYLFRIARILQERSREFAVLESMDSGKPIKESRDVDVPLAAAHFWYYAGWADKLEYAFPGRIAKPLGVAAQIIPWNFPLLMLAWKIAPALAAGNTVVLKPASTTPLSALLFADVCRQADLPPGVVNIIAGARRDRDGAGRCTPTSTRSRSPARPRSARRSSAASPAPTRRSRSSSAARPPTSCSTTRRSTRPSRASSTASTSTRARSAAPGRGCSSRSRSPTRSSTSSRTASRRSASATRSTRTPTSAPSTRRASSRRSPSSSQAGVDEGAELYQPPCDLPERGYYFRPTLFTNVAQSHRIAREEIFGPVLSMLTFRTPDEAVEKANNTVYGLSAGIWTDKGSRILSMVSKMRAGVVWANTFNRFDPTSPFGGYKQSGFGREGGMHGLHAYVRLEDR